MSGKGMNWRRVGSRNRMRDHGSVNVKDEGDRFERDAAARWLSRPKPERPQQPQPSKWKQKHKSKHVVVSGDGDPCPRCGRPMQVREHVAVTAKHRAQPFYYSRWFFCVNDSCATKQVMPPRFIVWNVTGRPRELLEARMLGKREEREADRAVEQAIERGELVEWGDTWDDGDTSGPPPWE